MNPHRRLVGETDEGAAASGGVRVAFEQALRFEGGDPAVDGGAGGAGGLREGGEGELVAVFETGRVEGQEHAPAGLRGERRAEAFGAKPAGGDQAVDEAGGQGDAAVVGHPAKPLRFGRLDEPGGEPAGVEAQHFERRADLLQSHRDLPAPLSASLLSD